MENFRWIYHWMVWTFAVCCACFAFCTLVGAFVGSLLSSSQILKFTGKDTYSPGDVSREAARRLQSVVDSLSELTASLQGIVQEEVLAYTGKDQYTVGDLSKVCFKCQEVGKMSVGRNATETR